MGTRLAWAFGVALVMMWVSAVNLHAGEKEEPKRPPVARYECRPRTGAIEIDGRLDEEAWSDAPRIAVRYPSNGHAPVDPPAAFARMTWDEASLYIGVDVDDANILAEGKGRDEAGIAPPNDVVEVFIDIADDPHHFFELHVTPNDARNDVFVIRPEEGSSLEKRTRWGMLFLKGFDLKEWPVAVRVAGTINDDSDRDEGWTVEMELPFRSLLMPFEGTGLRKGNRQKCPDIGQTWRIQLVVQNCDLAHRYYVWSPSDNPWHHKAWARWGRVEFVGGDE